MRHIDYRGVDVTKAALFVLLAVFLMITLIAAVLVPDVRKLKVAHMAVERSAILLSQARAEHQMQESLLDEARAKNRQLLEVLAAPLEPDQFHRQATTHFTLLEIQERRDDQRGDFGMQTLTLKAQMTEPGSFYDFVRFVQRSDRVLELEFPIRIEADAQRHLTWRFGLNDYYRLEESSD